MPKNGNGEPVALLDAKEQWSALAAAAKPLSGEDTFRPSPTSKGSIKAHGNWFFFFGVAVPVLSMIFEMTTHYCARHFFDPFPSPAHVVLFSLIPLSNYLCWLSARRDLSRHYAFMALVSGMAMGIGVLYSLMFITLTPTMIWYVFSFGIGLLGMAPLLSLPCTYLSGKSVCALAHLRKTYFEPHQVEHIGHLIVLIMVIAVELPSTLTRINLAMATETGTGHEQQAQHAIEWLRSFGSQEVMLRACYERSGRATDVLGTLYESHHPISVDAARRVFYQVTGKPFNSVPLPASARATIQHVGLVSDIAGVNAGVDDEFDLDADIAGEAVSGIARGLSVKASSLSGTIEGDAATAKLQWKFAFENTSKYDREARAKLLLPPGAIVTAAKIRMNNREADATIMVKSEARAMYRANIAARKDPLLVSTCGTDRILVQCFPVQPNAEVVVTLNIAAPLSIKQDGNAALILPAFEERNFLCDVPVEAKLESTKPVSLADPASAKLNQDSTDKVLSARIDTASLSRFAPIVNVQRDATVKSAWCEDKFARNNTFVTREIAPPRFNLPRSMTVIVDGSAAMQPYKEDIIKGLASIPKSMSTSLIFVGDMPLTLYNADNRVIDLGGRDLTSAVNRLSSLKFVGGQDDAKTLGAALDTEMASHGSVLWIHASQPIESPFNQAVKQFLEVEKKRPLLYDLQVSSGPNFVLADVEGSSSVVRVPRTGKLAHDIQTFFASSDLLTASGSLSDSKGSSALSPEHEEYRSSNAAPPAVSSNHKTDESLAQLYANKKITRLLQNPAAERQAYQYADVYHFVSPVSSAIVTEQLVTYSPTALPEPQQAFVIPNLLQLGQSALQSSTSTAFDAVVSQLNNLSSAARSTSGTISDEAEEFASRVGSSISGSQPQGIIGAPVDPRYGQAPENAATVPQRRKSGGTWGGDGFESDKGQYVGNNERQYAKSSESEEQYSSSVEGQTGTQMYHASNAPASGVAGGAFQLQEEANAPAPQLQGATNGTIDKDAAVVGTELLGRLEKAKENRSLGARSDGPGTVGQGKTGPAFARPVTTAATVSKAPTRRESLKSAERPAVPDTQFQIIDRDNSEPVAAPPPPAMAPSTPLQAKVDGSKLGRIEEAEKKREIRMEGVPAREPADTNRRAGESLEAYVARTGRQPHGFLDNTSMMLFIAGTAFALLGMIGVLAIYLNLVRQKSVQHNQNVSTKQDRTIRRKANGK